MNALFVHWIDGKREAKEKPDPRYPRGISLDLSQGAKATCETKLPYPAKRCGYYVVECALCNNHIVVTTAGRPDDPRAVKIACLPQTRKPQ